MINLAEVGATPAEGAGGSWTVTFGLYLPGITYDKGYRLKVLVIHGADQFDRDIAPAEFWMSWQKGSAHDLWTATVALATAPGSHFGQHGQYLYRYQLLRGDDVLVSAFGDPFARAVGTGTLSAFSVDPTTDFAWTDGGFKVPEVDEMVVYELNVREFNQDLAGVLAQLDYIAGLGVNVLELMPVTNVGEDVEWGYTPLGYFAPDERLGSPQDMKTLVDACHARNIAVVLDAVYAHAHPDFAYNRVYEASGEPNPMMGQFAGEFFSRPGMDYTKAFTGDYFVEVNRFWLAEYHVDGFRYDYVPGMYVGDPTGPGYADLVYRTYESSKGLPRFADGGGRSSIIQCAEHLPDPIGVLSKTYSNCCWQNGLLDRARDMARWGYVSEHLAHLLDPELIGYPREYRNPVTGEAFPVAPFQYLESHDHPRFLNTFGGPGLHDLLGERLGDRGRYFKTQPYVIALYTAKGIPMLWQGQEFGENWGLPDSGLGRNLYERPLHWEYFYDDAGKALVRLYRVLGELRRTRKSLGARGGFFYVDDAGHRQAGVIVFRRGPAEGSGSPADQMVVALNFHDVPAEVWVPFPAPGSWAERLDGRNVVEVGAGQEWVPVTVPSNYGCVYERA